MPNFTPMGAVPDFYSQIFNSAQNFTHLPDGRTFDPASFGGGQPGLTSRSVSTVPIDPMTGNPIMQPSGPSFQAGMRGRAQNPQLSPQQLEAAQAMVLGTFGRNNAPPPEPTFQAGMRGRGLSPVWANNSPGDIQSASAMNANDTVRDIPASSQPYIDATNPIDMFKQFGIMPSAPPNPAIGAIDQLTGSGRSTASPFPMPAFRSPLYSPPMDSGNSLVGPRDQAWVDQGPDMSALNAVAATGGSMPPMPQARPNLPTMPFPQSPMVRAGRQAPVPMPSPAFRNQSATVFDPSTGSFVTGRQPPPLPKRPSAAVKRQLKAQQNGGNQSPKPAGYGSKGYSEAGRALQALYGN